MARDIALTAVGAAAVSGILVLLIGSRGGPGGIVIDYDLTFPPIWGWATLVWMRKREYL
jgi:hypothetical protein